MQDNIVDKMYKYKIISSNDINYMKYALILLYEKYISVFSCLSIAVFFDCLVEMVLFLLFFCNLRKYTGGFHLKNFFSCYITSIFLSLFFVYVIKHIQLHECILITTFVVSTILIFCIGAVNHPNMGWSNCEEKKSKKKARDMVIIESTIICIMICTRFNLKMIFCMIFGEVICAVLLLLAKIFRQEVKKGEYDRKEDIKYNS